MDVARALVEAGGRAIVASSGGPMVHELERAGATHVTLPLDSKAPWQILANKGALMKVAQQHGVHVIHARSRAPAWSALWAARALGLPFVTTYHGTYTEDPFGFKRRYNRVMAKGDRVIAISQFIAAHIMQRHPVPPHRLRVIPRGIDLARFDPKAINPARVVALAQAWRLPDGVSVIMLPARLTRWKGHGVFLHALSKLRDRSWVAVLAGDDQGRVKYRQSLEMLARSLGIADRVHLVGRCDDLPAAYMLTDVVAAPSIEPEAFGRIPVEAQAMGRLVVAADHGGACETVLPGKTGWLSKPGDPHALAAALAAALDTSPEARAAMAAKAQEHARTHFSKAAMTAATLAVYNELLGHSP